MRIFFIDSQAFQYVLLSLFTCFVTVIVYFIVNQDWVLFKRGEVFYQNKQFEQALILYNDAISQGLEHPEVLKRVGDVNTALGHFAEAVKWYKLYLQKKPNDKRVRLSLARALSYEGNFEESTQEYKKVTGKEKK